MSPAMAATGARILVVEDDPKIARLLDDYLTAAGHTVETRSNGADGLRRAREIRPALLLLDLNLPGMDGVEVCRALRQESDMPVIMLTARIDEIDRLLGLESGADDYVCKPFSPRELVARVAALLRRAGGRVTQGTTPWEVDVNRQQIRWSGSWLPLTTVEFRLLLPLLQHPGRIFGRAQLLDAAHEGFRDVSDRAVDSHIKNIRRKMAAIAPEHDCITSIYGVGYRFDPD